MEQIAQYIDPKYAIIALVILVGIGVYYFYYYKSVEAPEMKITSEQQIMESANLPPLPPDEVMIPAMNHTNDEDLESSFPETPNEEPILEE